MLNAVTPEFETRLRALLPGAAFPELSEAHLREPRGRFAAEGGMLVAPGSAEEVAVLIRACGEAQVPVVPYGGGTGLVGGQIGQGCPAPVILSLARLSRIRAIDPVANVVTAEAGVILQDLQQAATEVDRLFPLSIAAKGSARIGGNLATNAGGLNVLRYGNARDLCLGLEAVLPDGQIWHGLGGLRKDNSGYDLRHLLIGSEGTLGVITAASLALYPIPPQQATALLVVPDPDAALALLGQAQDRLGGQISAFELMHAQGFHFLEETGLPARAPLTPVPEWSVLIEIGLFSGASAQDALETLFAEALERGVVRDGVIASSAAQRDALWQIRETIPEANRRIGSVSSHDISLPLAAVPQFIARAGQALAQLGAFRVNCFGHLGDGNLHYNVFPVQGKSRADYGAERPQVKRLVHDLTDEMGGSVAAEHGIGRLKVGDLERYGDPAKLSAMRAIKAALDPRGIMNPGAVLAQQ